MLLIHFKLDPAHIWHAHFEANEQRRAEVKAEAEARAKVKVKLKVKTKTKTRVDVYIGVVFAHSSSVVFGRFRWPKQAKQVGNLKANANAKSNANAESKSKSSRALAKIMAINGQTRRSANLNRLQTEITQLIGKQAANEWIFELGLCSDSCRLPCLPIGRYFAHRSGSFWLIAADFGA